MAADPTSLLAREFGSDGWSRTDHLLALVVDDLRLANWQRSRDGARNRNRPKPISPITQKQLPRTGHTDRSPGEVQAYLRRLNPRSA